VSHCDNIRQFSRDVYHFLTDVFSYRLNFSELGLTDHLVLQLARHSRFSGLNTVEIFKMPWIIESVYGNDIDLFIQNNSGTYNWYALQAKVMSSNGAFKDLKFKPFATSQQWDKLLLHETTFGSKTYYLLYSGRSSRHPTVTPTRTDCIGVPAIEELGLGIVETHVISAIRTVTLRPAQQFYFRHVFPNDIDSLRKLFCCFGNLPPTSRQFKREEIDTTGYQKIYFLEDREIGDSEYEPDSVTMKDGNAPLRLIVSSDDQNSSH
jgi:hypothetical protein